MVAQSTPFQPRLFAASPPSRQPLVVAYGLGVDSTAMLIGLKQRGRRPDLILFADTGNEKPDTYYYAPIFQQWLRDAGFPAFQVVRYRPKFADYDTLYGNCWNNETLPSLAFGRKSCSIKWKREPQDRYVRRWEPALEAWDAGMKVRKLIGFDAGEGYRRYGDAGDDPQYDYWYPLMEWGWTREHCKKVIAEAGLPVPTKSACFFCPAMKKPEIVQLAEESPDLFKQSLALEDRYRSGKHWRGEEASTLGLGRRFSWRTFAEHTMANPVLPLRYGPSIKEEDRDEERTVSPPPDRWLSVLRQPARRERPQQLRLHRRRREHRSRLPGLR